MSLFRATTKPAQQLRPDTLFAAKVTFLRRLMFICEPACNNSCLWAWQGQEVGRHPLWENTHPCRLPPALLSPPEHFISLPMAEGTKPPPLPDTTVDGEGAPCDPSSSK